MVSPRFLCTLISLVLLQSAVGVVRRFVVLRYRMWGNKDGDSAEFLAFFREYQNCEENPCKNGGICSKTEDGFHCDCVHLHYGRRCEQEEYSQDSEVCCTGKCERYDGRVNMTKSGRKCQRWDKNHPHRHVHQPKGYDGPCWSGPRRECSMENYCRNPNDHTNPWCYTTDPKKRWEDCDITYCTSFPLNEKEKEKELLDSELRRAASRLKSYKREWETNYIVRRESDHRFHTKFADAIPWMRSFLARGYSLANAAEKTVRYYANLPMIGKLKAN